MGRSSGVGESAAMFLGKGQDEEVPSGLEVTVFWEKQV